jgi:antirestriction protein
MEGQQQPGAGPETTGNEHDQQEQREVLREQRPRIYVASLSDYNNGELHGEWIDAAQDIEDVHQQIATMLARSSTTSLAEEYAVHDYEGFGPYRVGEYEPIDSVVRIAHGIAEHGLAFAAWAEQCDGDPERLAKFENAFLGSYDSLTDYAEQMLDDLGLQRIIDEHVPESLQPFVTVDAQAFGNDLVLGGDIAVARHDEGVWVFVCMV